MSVGLEPHLAAQRWLAHLVRVSLASERPGDPFDDDLAFAEAEARRLAKRHRIAPLLHRGLACGRIVDPLPARFRRFCELSYYATARKNAIALEVGRDLLARLARAGVDAAPLKGWALIEGEPCVYPDAALRPMDDLDLMVARADRARAMRILREAGFVRVTSAVALASGHEVAFHRRVAGASLFVELHWAWAGPESLMRSYALPGSEFLERHCRERGAQGSRQPTRLASLFYGAVHAARHGLERWIWLVDLHRLLTVAPLDWDRAIAEASRARVRRPLYAALVATRELLRTPIPREALARLAPGPLRRRLIRRTLAGSRSGRDRSGRFAKVLLGESWWDVARTAAWALRPGPDWYRLRGEEPSAGRRLTHPLRALAAPHEGSR